MQKITLQTGTVNSLPHAFSHTLTFIKHFELIHKLLLSSFWHFSLILFLLLQMLHFIDILNHSINQHLGSF